MTFGSISCIFGISNETDSPEVIGTLLDYVSEMNRDGNFTEAVNKALQDTIVPIAAEFAYNFSPLPWLEAVSTLLTSSLVC